MCASVAVIGVFEVIGVIVALVAEIEPGVRVLMGEDRVVAADIGEVLVMNDGAGPVFPVFAGYGMRGRADGQQIDHHEFAEVGPSRIEKAATRVPSHRECFAAVQHPRPVDAFVNLRGERLDFRIVEVCARGENCRRAAEMCRWRRARRLFTRSPVSMSLKW